MKRRTWIRLIVAAFLLGAIAWGASLGRRDLLSPVARYETASREVVFDGAEAHVFRMTHLQGITAKRAEELLAPHLTALGFTTRGEPQTFSYLSRKQGSDELIAILDAEPVMPGVLILTDHVPGRSELFFRQLAAMGESIYSPDGVTAGGPKTFLGQTN